MAWTLKQLARHVNGQVRGDGAVCIESVATLKTAKTGQISFLTNSHYKSELRHTAASAVIVEPAHADDAITNLIIVDNPHAAYARIAQLLYPLQSHSAAIHATAVVHPDAQIGKNVCIAAHAVIEAGAIIADDCYIHAGVYVGEASQIGQASVIYANVSIQHGVIVGQRAIIHSGAVIGADGFGQAYDQGQWLKVPQIGGVVIGDDVEIGANTTIDRGAIENTVIEDGVKLDNQIQIAHNVVIGAHTVVAAATAIAGSARIGRHCMIAGLVGIAGHIELADNVVVTAMSTVTRSIKESGSYSSGIPTEPTRLWRRYVGRFKRLDSLTKRITECEKQLKEKD